MRVLPIPVLSDNYMYLLINDRTKEAAIVDPVEIDPIASAVKSSEVKLIASLVTHHHWDHAGATNKLAETFGNLSIHGADERIVGLTNQVADGDIIKVGELNIQCIATPCHTSGSVCYYVVDNENKAVFTGDTLFIGGCGRFFEGDASQMDAAMKKLAELPDETNVYCGHEYTVDNLIFARSVEPNNAAISAKLAWAQDRRSKDEYTVPSTIAEEKAYNPFMRNRVTELQNAINLVDPIKAMNFLRTKKNHFKE